jgi:predicted  nucleic acid-binding Zn-ribbon protein
MSTKIDELFATLAALLADQTRDLALAMAEIDSVTAERDKARLHLASLQSCLNSAAKSVRESEIAANNARQSLRAAEQDLAETESVNSDLRTVNARLVADLAAAIERLNHAESILMQ